MNRDPITNLTKAFKDLVEGTEYEYRVSAENEAGIGKPSQTTGVFTAKDPFDKPGKPGTPEVSDITQDSANLTWTAPQKDGGAPITGYVVEMREAAANKWLSASRGTVSDLTFKVTGLREGVKYEFRVTAENKAGQGPPSSPSRPAHYGKSH